MRVLVTGSDGYIGTVLVPMFESAGHEVVRLDSYLFAECVFGDVPSPRSGWSVDVRAAGPEQLAGIEAIVHLAGISNDPLGDLDPEITYAINHRATVRLARLAKAASVSRFVFSSSCSLY